MDRPFITIDPQFFVIHPKAVEPKIEGYKPHEDQEASGKFPNCCGFHSKAYEELEKWFEGFPYFTPEDEITYNGWFKKSIYEGLPIKIITQLSYTEYFIAQKINTPDWNQDILHYIDYNYLSFGNPNFGSRWYLIFVKYYLANIETGIDGKKRDKIIAYLDKKLALPKKTIKEGEGAGFEVIYATIQKWIKLFPFEIENFKEYKKDYERRWLVITGTPDYNPYSGTTRIKTITKRELIKELATTTKDLLQQVNSVDFVNSSNTQGINKYNMGIIIQSHSLKQQKLLNEFVPEEVTYIEILEKWLENEKVFFGEMGKLLKENCNYSNNLKTFNTPLTEAQLEKLRAILISKEYVSRISKESFAYLFQGNPVTLTMDRLKWLMPNSYCHYFLKQAVFNGGGFDFIQVNHCIIGKDGKKLASNSKKQEYIEIDNILNQIKGSKV